MQGLQARHHRHQLLLLPHHHLRLHQDPGEPLRGGQRTHEQAPGRHLGLPDFHSNHAADQPNIGGDRGNGEPSGRGVPSAISEPDLVDRVGPGVRDLHFGGAHLPAVDDRRQAAELGEIET